MVKNMFIRLFSVRYRTIESYLEIIFCTLYFFIKSKLFFALNKNFQKFNINVIYWQIYIF